ncbi:hypothetical protein GW17_00053370 [Ensete ventricosum]|nr:hypothetical protein GW17_00053370 [Ensete ventricosum]
MIYNTRYKSSCTSTEQRDQKIDHYTNLTVGGVTSGTYPTRPPCRSRRPTRAEAPPPGLNSTTPVADLHGRIRGIHPSGRAPTPSQDDRGRASAQGSEPAKEGPCRKNASLGTRVQSTTRNLTTSANRGGHGSRADFEPFLEDDDRPGVLFTRIQSRAVRGHERDFPRPHQPSSSASGYGTNHSPVPTSARAFDNSPNGSPSGTPANGVTSSPEPGGPARGRAATASGHRNSCNFPDPDTSPITKSLLRSDTDRTRPRRLIVRHC